MPYSTKRNHRIKIPGIKIPVIISPEKNPREQIFPEKKSPKLYLTNISLIKLVGKKIHNT